MSDLTGLNRVLSCPLVPAILLRERTVLVEAISVLNTRWNQLAPVAALSAEVLSEVFLNIAAFSRERAEHPGYLTPAEVRACTADVCRYWRNVARGSARLWGFIDFAWDTYEYVKGALEKSKGTLLFVQASLNRRSVATNVLLALQHTARIQCLDLSFETASQFERLSPTLIRAAPALEVLRVHCHIAFIRLPHDLFSCDTPVLRELDLRACVITRDSHLLSRTLTNLSVNMMPVGCTFSVPHWLVILGSLPLLQVLCLSRCFTSNMPLQESEIRSAVELPNLFSLTLESRIFECSELLGHLVFPPAPRLRIKCCGAASEADRQYLAALLPHVSRSLKYLPDADRLRTLDITWCQDELTLRGSLGVSPDSEDAECSLSFVSGRLPFRSLLHIVGGLPTRDICVLNVWSPLYARPVWLPELHGLFGAKDGWEVLLRCFPGVHTLGRIQYDWAASMLALLTSSAVAAAQKIDGRVLLPALHTLAFVNTAFDMPSIIPALLSFLRARKACGMPIKHIKADHCKNVHSTLRLLDNVGAEVVWDGKCRFEDD